ANVGQAGTLQAEEGGCGSDAAIAVRRHALIEIDAGVNSRCPDFISRFPLAIVTLQRCDWQVDGTGNVPTARAALRLSGEGVGIAGVDNLATAVFDQVQVVRSITNEPRADIRGETGG